MEGMHHFKIRGSTPSDVTIEVDGVPDLTIKRISFTVGVDSTVAQVTVTYDATIDVEVDTEVVDDAVTIQLDMAEMHRQLIPVVQRYKWRTGTTGLT